MVTAEKVGKTTFTTPSDREVVATRVVDAPRRLMWDAWTNPEHVPHWMLGPPGWTASYDLLDAYLPTMVQTIRTGHGA